VRACAHRGECTCVFVSVYVVVCSKKKSTMVQILERIMVLSHVFVAPRGSRLGWRREGLGVPNLGALRA
jgi:hypothetical protein